MKYKLWEANGWWWITKYDQWKADSTRCSFLDAEKQWVPSPITYETIKIKKFFNTRRFAISVLKSIDKNAVIIESDR